MILLTFVGSALFVGLRCILREPISDDLLYRYVLDNNPLGENDYSTLVSGWKDAVESQIVQYFYSNGRFFIHVLVQMFAGPWGFKAYSVFTACLFFVVTVLFGIYCLPSGRRYNPLFWLGISVAYLYLFQSNSGTWYSIAGGLNYLLPMFLVLVFLLLYRRFGRDVQRESPLLYALLGVVGFVVGWSQECYSLPLSGGVFLALSLSLVRHERIAPAIWVLAVSLWIGTCILVFAPGNFVRLGTRPGLLSSLVNGVKLLAGTRLFWLMIASLIVLRLFSKRGFGRFVADNMVVFLVLCVALCFGMVANTLPQSFNGISFYSAIILFSMASCLPEQDSGRSVVALSVTACLLGLIFWHQSRIVEGCRIIKDINHEFVQSYIDSPDGVMAVPEVSLPGDVLPFVHNWFGSSVRWWLMYTLEEHYTKGEKRITLLEKKDSRAYNEGSLSSMDNDVIAGCRGVCNGENYLWFEIAEAPLAGDSIEIELAPMASENNLRTKLASILIGKTGAGYSNRVLIDVNDESLVCSRSKSLVGVCVGPRDIKNVKIIRSDKSI